MTPATPAPGPAVTFWGAAQTVTGSMHLLQVNGRKLLLDCGLFQGPRAEARQRNRTFPFAPADIEAVVVRAAPPPPRRHPAPPPTPRRGAVAGRAPAPPRHERPGRGHARRLGEDPGRRRGLPHPQPRARPAPRRAAL